MSVELYPNIADLDEKLSALEDAELAQRIVSANPQLFGGVAAREEISVFAAAWKRFGTLALAVTAALAIGAGYVFTPHAAVHPALKPVAPRIAVREKSPVVGRIEKLVVHPLRHAVAAPAAVAAPVAAPVHHTVAYRHPAAASHAAAPAAHAAAAPSAASSAGTQVEAPIQYEANAEVVSSANAPPTDAVPPSGTKTGIVSESGGSTSVQAILNSCTPQGGRLAAITQR